MYVKISKLSATNEISEKECNSGNAISYKLIFCLAYIVIHEWMKLPREEKW